MADSRVGPRPGDRNLAIDTSANQACSRLQDAQSPGAGRPVTTLDGDAHHGGP
jgi:hypothetical protein